MLVVKAIDREALFWEHEANRAVRASRRKLVAVRGKPWELWDLDTDRTERRDLASRHPESIAALSTRWDDRVRRLKTLASPAGGTTRKN